MLSTPLYFTILTVCILYRMPNMDGPSAAESIRSLGYRGRIVGVTGNAMQHDIDHFIHKGADQVFVKPVDIKALLRLLVSDV